MQRIKKLLRENLSSQTLNRLRSLRSQLADGRIAERIRDSLLKTRIVRSFPQLYVRLLVRKIGYPDPELHLLPSLCEETKCSVDIGSHKGDYAFHMLRHSSRCHIFEPRPGAIKKIRGRLEGASLPVTVHSMALSDTEGSMSLRVVPGCPERSTLETSNQLEELEEKHVTVPVRRLDDCELGEVGCIKIDVEGHEEAVVKGAIQTIRRDRPSLIIEAEERHNPGGLERLTSLLSPLGYEGHFLKSGELRSIESFDVYEHQTSLISSKYVGEKENYINNFIFINESSRLV
jgi:FkbM family methyltransferase